MCKRINPPFKNMYNLIGGKVEESESIKSSVYREMLEEISLTCDDVILHPIMDINILSRQTADICLFWYTK